MGDDVCVELSDAPVRDGDSRLSASTCQSFPSHWQDRHADEVAMKLVLCEGMSPHDVSSAPPNALPGIHDVPPSASRQESGDPLYKSMLEDRDVCEVTTNVAASIACCGLRQTGRDTRNVMC